MVPRATVPVSRSALEQSDPYLAQSAAADNSSQPRSSTISVSAPALAEMDRTDSQQRRQTRFLDGDNRQPSTSNRSSTSLRDKSNNGYGRTAAVGVAGAGAGAYAAHRLDGDDRGYAVASGYQQPQYAQPQNNFMQQDQGRQGLVPVTPAGVGLAAPTGQTTSASTRNMEAAPPVATYMNGPAHQPLVTRQESRRSNIFDSMAGVPGQFTFLFYMVEL